MKSKIFDNKIIPRSISIFLLIFISVWMSDGLSKGDQLHWDEFYTLERSLGFEKHGDWFSVYTANHKSTQKPPLQYWLTAFNLKSGMPDLQAIRLWPFIFFIGLLCSVAGISFYFSQENSWVVPASILFMCCSPNLIWLSRSGMLDVGMSFFLMLSILLLLYAKKYPKLWILCGLILGLGALQKAPIAILLVGVVILGLSLRNDPYYTWKNLIKIPEFNWGFCLTTCLFFFWPVLQTFTYGGGYLSGAYKKQILMRFSPIGEERGKIDGIWVWLEWLWADWKILAILAICCLLFVLYFRRWRRINLLFSLAICPCLIAITFAMAKGSIYSRYMVVMIPFLVVSMVKVISDLSSYRPLPFIVAAVFLAVSFDNIATAKQINYRVNRGYNYSTMKNTIIFLEQIMADRDVLVSTDRVIAPGAYGYFGHTIQPDFKLKWDITDQNDLVKLEEFINKHKGKEIKIFGVTKTSNKNIVSEISGGELKVIREFNRVLIWQYNERFSTIMN